MVRTSVYVNSGFVSDLSSPLAPNTNPRVNQDRETPIDPEGRPTSSDWHHKHGFAGCSMGLTRPLFATSRLGEFILLPIIYFSFHGTPSEVNFAGIFVPTYFDSCLFAAQAIIHPTRRPGYHSSNAIVGICSFVRRPGYNSSNAIIDIYNCNQSTQRR